MYINQMALDSSVTLKVHTGKDIVEFDTRVIDVFPEKFEKGLYGIGVEPIRIDDKLVNFGSYPIEAYFTNFDDNRNYVYALRGLGLSKDHERLVLFSSVNVKAVNHRESYRVPCMYKVVMQIGPNRHTVNGRAHDISFGGISFVYFAHDIKNVSVNDSVSASVYDKDGMMYRLSGEIVRIVDDYKEEGQSLIGVKFKNPSQDVMHMIVKLQRDELKLRRHQHSITG